MRRVGRRAVLAAGVGTLTGLAGCGGGGGDRVTVGRVERVAVEDATVRDLPSLPEPLRNAIENGLARGAATSRWRLSASPTENEALEDALATTDYAVATGNGQLLAGVHATFEYDPDTEDGVVRSTAVLPGDVGDPAPPVYGLVDLPDGLRSAVRTAIEEGTTARAGDARAYAGSRYDGAYITGDGTVYRTAIDTVV